MVHSTPLRVSMYGHWDDHAVDKMSLYKSGIHYTSDHTDLRWLEGKNHLTWLDLNNYVTWLENKIAMTWLSLNSRLEYFWLDLTCDSSKGDLLQRWVLPWLFSSKNERYLMLQLALHMLTFKHHNKVMLQSFLNRGKRFPSDCKSWERLLTRWAITRIGICFRDHQKFPQLLLARIVLLQYSSALYDKLHIRHTYFWWTFSIDYNSEEKKRHVTAT